jgi:8-oxo-dGTP pyrophosphatase MutT (NUDIX family)
LLSFDPNQEREPAVPRDAATVVVVRDGPRGLEVFLVVRHAKSGFLGGALVFPGGKVDPSDSAGGWAEVATEPPLRAREFSTEAASPRALAVAACREAFEEANILPTAPTLGASELDEVAGEITELGGVLLAALARRGLRLAVHELVPLARWVTPTAESRRFDARFFLLELPRGQVGKADEHEATHGFWERPAGALERAARGEVFLAPPTARVLELLATAGDVAAAKAVASRQSLEPICPVFVPGDPPYVALPGDPSHPVRERVVDGPSRYVIREGLFVAEDPPDGPSPSASPHVPPPQVTPPHDEPPSTEKGWSVSWKR